MTEPRGFAYLDFPNITTGGYSLGIGRYNYSKLMEVLLKGTRSVGCNLYIVNKGNRQELFRYIESRGIQVIPVNPGKSIDGRLIFDLLIGAHRDDFDTAIIASGDKDFIPVINYVKRLDKDVKVASFSRSIGDAMKTISDDYINLDDHVEEIAQSKRRMHKIKCATCGKEDEVPFKPKKGTPVYCNACFRKRRR